MSILTRSLVLVLPILALSLGRSAAPLQAQTRSSEGRSHASSAPDQTLEHQAGLAGITAVLAELQGDDAGAIAAYGQARDLYHQAGDAGGEAGSIGKIAALREKQGDYQGALDLRNQELRPPGRAAPQRRRTPSRV